MDSMDKRRLAKNDPADKGTASVVVASTTASVTATVEAAAAVHCVHLSTSYLIVY